MIEVLSAIAVAGGLLVGRWVAVWHQKKALPPTAANAASENGNAERARGEGRLKNDEEARADERIDWLAFPCALGDVVIRTLDGAEAWLAGAIVLREDAPAAVLFLAPDAAGDRAIYARPRPRAELAWLLPVRRDSLLVGTEPPSAIEIDGLRFERLRRLPFRVQRVGTGAPDVGETALVGEYGAVSGEVALVLIADGVGRAWQGRKLDEAEYEVWSGEKTRA
jgi:hypothetical protein